METEKNLGQGMSPRAAATRARKAFGGAERHKETLRDGLGFPRFEDFLKDAMIALRGLQRSPLFTVTVVVTLALGVGACASIFSAVNELLLRPLPYADADRLVMMYAKHEERGISGSNVSYPDYESWAEETETFQSLGIFTWWSGTFGSGLGAERIQGALLSSTMLDVLQVQPLLGQGFQQADCQIGAAPTVLLSHSLWRRRFAADPNIVGTQVQVEGSPHTVLGVMPPSFRFPSGEEAWLPMIPGKYHAMRNARFLAGSLARLHGNVSIASAQADLQNVAEALETEFPNTNDGWSAHLVPLREDLVGPLGASLWILLGAILILLVVICANVGGLILARSLSRAPEFALRQALGANRGRLLTQIGTESLVLGGFSAVVSAAVLWFGLSSLETLLVQEFSIVQDFALRGPAVLFFLVLIVASTLLFGLVPIAGLSPRLSKRRLNKRLGQGHRNAGSHLSTWGRSTLVAGELALVMVLLVASGLLIRTLHSLENIHPGFRTDVLTARIGLSPDEFPDDASRLATTDRIIERLRALPGVEAVGAAQGLPFSGWNVHQSYRVVGEPTADPGKELNAHVQAVHSDFFHALGVPMVRGRALHIDEQNSVLINESFAKHHFANQEGLGAEIVLDDDRHTIVGIISNYRHFRLVDEMTPAIYVPWKLYAPSRVSIALRTAGTPSEWTASLRRTIAEVAPNSPAYRIQTMADVVHRQSQNSRIVRNLLATFSGLAVLLALLGLFATVKYMVDQRRREFGLRVALGATPGALVAAIMRQGLAMVCLGIGVGIAIGLGLTRYLSGLLFGVAPGDPWTFATTAIVVFAMAALATWIPAHQAARRNPVASLRSH